MHPHFPMGPQPSTPRVSRQLAVPFTCRSRPVLLQSSPLCIGLRKLATALSPRGQRHWNPRMLSRLYNNLDHFTHHPRHSQGQCGEERNRQKWRQTLSFSSLSSPFPSSFCPAQPPPATTTATPSAKAFSSSKASAPANSPPTSASAGATTLHCTTAPPPE